MHSQAHLLVLSLGCRLALLPGLCQLHIQVLDNLSKSLWRQANT